jgi:hypothetical protein
VSSATSTTRALTAGEISSSCNISCVDLVLTKRPPTPPKETPDCAFGGFSRYDGWAGLNVTLGEQSMGFSRYDGWAGLNVTLGEQSMDWFRGFFVTLIFVGSLQPAARPTDPTEH